MSDWFLTVFPVYIISIVAFVGTFSPSSAQGERYDKVIVGITTLLSMSILMLTVSSMMPVTSDEVPIICMHFLILYVVNASKMSFMYYIIAEFYGSFLVMISLATILSTFVIQIESYGFVERPVPNWAKWVFIDKLGRLIAWDMIQLEKKPITRQKSKVRIKGCIKDPLAVNPVLWRWLFIRNPLWKWQSIWKNRI